MDKIEVSIIIPAWHEEKTMVRTLDVLKQLDYPLKECELIITASADDATYSIAKGKDMHEFGRYLVLKQNPGGKNAALQQGIKESKGEIIVLLDADTLVDEEWLAELIGPIKSRMVDCTNGNEFPLNKSLFSSYFMIEKIYGMQFLKQQSTHGGGGIAFRKDIISKIGLDVLFDKTIKAGVDCNLGAQILKGGKNIYFTEKAKTKTFYNKTFKGFVKDALRWKKAYSSLISRKKLFKILLFNSSIILSLILFLSAFLFYPKFPLYLPFIFYSSYLLFQCAVSAVVSSKISMFFYFPTYLLLNLIDRASTFYVFFGKFLGFDFQQKMHFKGER